MHLPATLCFYVEYFRFGCALKRKIRLSTQMLHCLYNNVMFFFCKYLFHLPRHPGGNSEDEHFERQQAGVEGVEGQEWILVGPSGCRRSALHADSGLCDAAASTLSRRSTLFRENSNAHVIFYACITLPRPWSSRLVGRF
jgi:hypothetical protein